jgi:xylulose-5-phosphate/fructose-6-phosphate phosphoketolase
MSTTATLPSTEILSAEEHHKIDAYWRACNYLCVGMFIYWRTRCCANR